MRIPCSPSVCSQLGRKLGIGLAVVYSGIVAAVWIFSELPYDTLAQLIFDFLWFWLYGSVIGGVIGAIVGTFTGYIICYICKRLTMERKLPNWVLGCGVCVLIWSVLSFTVGFPFLVDTEPVARTTFTVLFLLPGLIYIVAGTVLSSFLQK